MAQDVIVSAFSNYGYDDVKPYIESINAHFSGDRVLICINTTEETDQKIRDAGWQVVKKKSDGKMMFHMERFIHTYEFLKQNKGKYRYAISTDVRDVIFQSDPFKYFGKHFKGLFVSSENIKIKDEKWNRNNIAKNFGKFYLQQVENEEILNVGILGGQADLVCDMIGMLFQLSLNRPDWVADQAAYNILMNMKPYKDLITVRGLEHNWACNLHVTNYKGAENLKPFLTAKPPLFTNGTVTNSDGTPFVIVHQYDRDAEIKKYYEEKYGVTINSQYTPNDDIITFRTN